MNYINLQLLLSSIQTPGADKIILKEHFHFLSLTQSILQAMLKRVLTYTVFTIFYLNLHSQTPRFDPINITNGLTDNAVYSLEVDLTGNIWFGTRNGLNRFNGFNMQEYKPTPHNNYSIHGNTITALATDPDGALWALTTSGALCNFDPKRERFISYLDSSGQVFFSENPGSICHASNGLIWIQNAFTLLCFNKQTKQFRVIDPGQDILGINLYNDSCLLYCGDFGLKKIEIRNNQLSIKKIGSTPVHKMIALDSGYFAVNNQSVYYFNKQLKLIDTLITFDTKVIQPNYVTALAVSDEYLWVGFKYGLYRIRLSRTKEFPRLSPQQNLSPSFLNEHITSLKYDKAGNLWIATTEKGVFHYSHHRNLFEFINWNFNAIADTSVEYRINSDPISAICRTQRNELWLGSSKSGVGIIHSNGSRELVRNYFDRQGNRHALKLVRSIFEDSQGTLWMATQENICYYNRKTKRIETLASKYGWEWNYNSMLIKEFKKGTLTITGEKYIGEVDLNSGNLKLLPTHSNGVYLWSMFQDAALDKHSNLWLIQYNHGLIQIDSSHTTYTRYLKATHGFSDNKIYSIVISGDSIWLGTNSGLDLFSISANRVIKSYTKEDGLSSDIIYSIHIDSLNHLWMGTSKGISRLNIASGTITTYLLNTYFFNNSKCIDPDGSILFGGYNTVVHFRPGAIENILNEPKPVINQFVLFNRTVHPGDTIDKKILLKSMLTDQSQITLTYKQNSFSIGFNAYPFNYPNNITFRYRLKGAQENWQYSQRNTRLANYTSLQPGEYLFEVSASNQSQNWSRPVELKITITPPFWRRIGFQITLILLLILAAISYFRYRIRSIKRRNLWLERRVQEQTFALKEQTQLLLKQNEEIKVISDKLHEADQSKLRFFTNISHEFRTPLTIILGHLEKINEGKYNRSKSIIRRNAYRLLDLINQLIEIRKLDLDQLKLKVNSFDLIEFCSNIISSFQVIAEQKNIQLQFYTDLKKLQVWLDKDKTEKVLYNLLSNAIKYTPRDKNVLLSVKTNEAWIQILVEDEGIGIDKKDISRIFERFYRSNAHSESGHGIGLALSKGLVEIQHGTIEVSSQPCVGSIFTIQFKKGKDHFNPDDFGSTITESPMVLETEEFQVNSATNITDKKILLVEDNTELSNYIIDLLQARYSVRRVSNGQEALLLLQEYTPDLIISDILMPVMDGIEFCKLVKSSFETSHIPLILLSAKTETDTKVEGFELGIDDYIEKPFKPQVLLARISALLRNRDKLNEHLQNFSADSKINEPGDLTERDKEFWNKIQHLVKENYGDTEFNASVLSDLMLMSRANFYRKFKGLSGINAAEHIRKYRMHQAMKLIQEGETNISYISLNVGFKSISQFRQSFKEEFGKGLSEFL